MLIIVVAFSSEYSGKWSTILVFIEHLIVIYMNRKYQDNYIFCDNLKVSYEGGFTETL